MMLAPATGHMMPCQISSGKFTLLPMCVKHPIWVHPRSLRSTFFKLEKREALKKGPPDAARPDSVPTKPLSIQQVQIESLCSNCVCVRRSSRSMLAAFPRTQDHVISGVSPRVHGFMVPQNACAVLNHFKIFKEANALPLSL